MSTGREIRLTEAGEGGWSAIHEEPGVASQGDTLEEALTNLAESIAPTQEAREADPDAPEPDPPWSDG